MSHGYDHIRDPSSETHEAGHNAMQSLTQPTIVRTQIVIGDVAEQLLGSAICLYGRS